MRGHELRQLVLGNPGTSYIVCLLHILEEQFGLKTNNDEQYEIFSAGLRSSRRTFFSGAASVIAKRYRRRIIIYTNSSAIVARAKKEVTNRWIQVAWQQLAPAGLLRLLEKHRALVVSVDFHRFSLYHDYHFVTLEREPPGLRLFEPKRGCHVTLSKKTVPLLKSVTTGLHDAVIAMAII